MNNLDIEIWYDCLTIMDSYKVKKSDMKNILNDILKNYPQFDNVFNIRGIDSMYKEWVCHNFAYNIGLLRFYSKDVSMQINLPWYEKYTYKYFYYIAKFFVK